MVIANLDIPTTERNIKMNARRWGSLRQEGRYEEDEPTATTSGMNEPTTCQLASSPAGTDCDDTTSTKSTFEPTPKQKWSLEEKS